MACAQLRRCRDESPCAAFAVLMGTPAGSGKIGKGNVRLQLRGYGGLIYGCFGQLLGIFGIHHILNFLEISMLSQTGWNMFNPIGTCGNMAQAGAVLAVAIKSRNTKMKQIAYPSAFSATLGITEPAVFGVTLRLGKPFIMSMIGGGAGGFLASILGLKATGIPGTLLYLNNQLPYYILTNVVAMAVAFALTYTIGYKEEAETAPASKGSGSPAPVPSAPSGIKCAPGTVYAPVSGAVIPSEQIPDETFATGVLGKGVGIQPADGVIAAPFDGEISTVADTRHAVGITSPDGMEVLIHVGVDTVAMNGDGFTALVQEGQKVKAGETLLTFDQTKIAAAQHPDVVVVLVTNSDDYENLTIQPGKCKVLDKVIEVK